jgi:hypothetical protein
LGLWEKLTVLEINGETVTVGGNQGNWVKVKREKSNVQGWCFSHFLEEIDVNNFFPILEYWGFPNYNIGPSRNTNEIYTLYNDNRKRDKLILYWENKTIDNFEILTVSNNGRIIAFTWLDTATIRRDSREGTISGNRILFFYNFETHNLYKIDETYITQSDAFSERWRGGKHITDYDGYADGFYLEYNLTKYFFNSSGTKLFYEKDNAGIEVDLATRRKTTLRVSNALYYLGNHLVARTSRNDDHRWQGMLYNPQNNSTITGFHSVRDGEYNRPLAVVNGRNLIIEQYDGNRRPSLIIHDVITNQRRTLNDLDLYDGYSRQEWDGGIYHENFWRDDYYYVLTSLYKKSTRAVTYVIRKIDYNNRILEEVVLNNISRGMTLSSYSPRTTLTNYGIVEISYGNHIYTDNRPDSNQSWLFVYSFDGSFRQFRFDSTQTYKGDYGLFLMNND